jgi:hypothetical protein
MQVRGQGNSPQKYQIRRSTGSTSELSGRSNSAGALDQLEDCESKPGERWCPLAGEKQ